MNIRFRIETVAGCSDDWQSVGSRTHFLLSGSMLASAERLYGPVPPFIERASCLRTCRGGFSNSTSIEIDRWAFTNGLTPV
jgi:hypothetical protein